MELPLEHIQTELQLVTDQLKQLILSQLTIRRKKCTVQHVHQPTTIMSDKIIFQFLEKRLVVSNNKIYFKGKAYYETQLWPTQTESQQNKIVKYVIEQNTIR